jgi:ATP-binding cassette, subfamily B, bacterial
MLQIWRRLSGYIQHPRLRVAAIVGSSLLGAMSEAMVLVLVVAVAMLAAGQTTSLPEIPLVGITLSPSLALTFAGALGSLNIAAHFLNSRVTALVAAEVLGAARHRILDGFFRATWAKQAIQRDGELIENAGVLAERVSLAAVLLAVGVSSAVQMIALLVAAALIDPLATLVVLCAGILVFAILRPLILAINRRSERSVSANTDFLNKLSNFAGTALELRAFGVEDAVLKSLQSESLDAAKAFGSTQTAVRISTTLYRNLAILFLVGAVTVIYTVEPADLASLAAVVLLVLRSVNSAQGLQTLRGQAAEYKPTFDLLESRIGDLLGNRRSPGTQPVERINTLEICNVSYKYSSDRPALRNVNLTISVEETIGVVGPSGGGKSTLVQILLRLRNPDEGHVLVDGMPYDEIKDSDWNRLVAVVPQDGHLIEGTIGENVAFMRPGVDETGVIEALSRAHIWGEIERLPDGLATRLGSRGLGLSGGQRQRLMIARALAGQPKMLVLDEPTSALDELSERGLRDTLAELANHVGLILVTHRPVPLQICSRIITIEDGRITKVDVR